MTTFKQGDKVRISNPYDWADLIEADPDGAAARGIFAGNTGTVASVGAGGNVVGVITDNASIAEPAEGPFMGVRGWAFYPDELEKVEG